MKGIGPGDSLGPSNPGDSKWQNQSQLTHWSNPCIIGRCILSTED